MTGGGDREERKAPGTPALERAAEVESPPPGDSARTRLAGHARRAQLLIAVLTVGLLWVCAPYLTGLLGALVLYVVCAPVYRRLAPRLGARTTALTLTVGAAVLLVLPAGWLVAAAIQEAPVALQHVRDSRAFSRAAELRIGPIDVGAQLMRAGENVITWASSRAFDVAGSLTHALLNLLLALLGLYYLLPSAAKLWAQVRPLIPFSPEGAEALRERFASVTAATLLGVLATAVSQGAIVGLGFWAVGLPSPLVWGVVTGVASVLPILGSALVWVPGVLVLVADGRYGAAAALGLIGLVLASNVDNVVRPIVYRRLSGLHPMATLVGAFAGVELIGLLGLLLGPLAISYWLELLRLYRKEYGR